MSINPGEVVTCEEPRRPNPSQPVAIAGQVKRESGTGLSPIVFMNAS